MGEPYSISAESATIIFFNTLTEKGRRLFAAVEALKLGHGGISHISGLSDIDRSTIYRGMKELRQPDTLDDTRVRSVGGGRKDCIANTPGINEKFFEIIRSYAVGQHNTDLV